MSSSSETTARDALRQRLQLDLSRDPGILILASPYARTWKPILHAAARESPAWVNRDEPASLYVNLPFCRRKCVFCDFPACHDRQETELEQYVGLLGDELHVVAQATCRQRWKW